MMMTAEKHKIQLQNLCDSVQFSYSFMAEKLSALYSLFQQLQAMEADQEELRMLLPGTMEEHPEALALLQVVMGKIQDQAKLHQKAMEVLDELTAFSNVLLHQSKNFERSTEEALAEQMQHSLSVDQQSPTTAASTTVTGIPGNYQFMNEDLCLMANHLKRLFALFTDMLKMIRGSLAYATHIKLPEPHALLCPELSFNFDSALHPKASPPMAVQKALERLGWAAAEAVKAENSRKSQGDYSTLLNGTGTKEEDNWTNDEEFFAVMNVSSINGGGGSHMS